MPDLTAGGVPVYRDSAGVLREKVEGSGGANVASTVDGAAMRYVQFTAEQLATVQRLAPPAGATSARVESNGGTAVRYRGDGIDPTPAVGMLIIAGDFRMFTGDLTKVAFIDQGSNAVLDVTYYG